MAQRRIVVLVTDVEYKEIKRAAGIASMSAYIKSRVLEAYNGDDRHEAGAGESKKGAHKVFPRDRVEASVSADACPHKKQRGELCYKCDPKFGKPEIG